MLVVTTKEVITSEWFPHCSLVLSNHTVSAKHQYEDL